MPCHRRTSPPAISIRVCYTSYMSASSETREWVEGLPADTWFRGSAVPHKSTVVRSVLSRLLNEPDPIIGRASHGVYWRQRPPRDPWYGKLPSVTANVWAMLSPDGAGYARANALWQVGWATQVPIRPVVAVPYRNLTPPVLSRGPTPVFQVRYNLRRRELNWNEATLLEAAQSFVFASRRPWKYLLERAAHPGWMVRGAPIRKKMLLWAAETEPPPKRALRTSGDRSFEAVMARLERDLPDIMESA